MHHQVDCGPAGAGVNLTVAPQDSGQYGQVKTRRTSWTTIDLVTSYWFLHYRRLGIQ